MSLTKKSFIEQTEELFLRIFKIVILLVMSIGLLVAIGFTIYAAAQYFQHPKEPIPARVAPKEEISLDGLIEQLTPKQDEDKKQETKKDAVTSQQAPALKYLEEVTALYRCSVSFAKSSGFAVEESDAAAASAEIERYRSQIEKIAAQNARRGDDYVKDSVRFVCAALSNDKVIALRKSGKISGVFLGTLNYHLSQWDKNQLRLIDFDESEKNRISSERTAENIRVEIAHASALASITAAGIAFAVFMAIALYLIFAKIENNLRTISGHIQNFAEPG